jgi:hypothetical protein
MQTWLGSSFSYLLECIVLCRAIEKDSVGVHSDSLLSLVKAVEFFQLCWNPLVFQLWIIHQFVLVCDCLLGDMMDNTIAHLFNVNCMVEPSWEFNESPLNFRFITCYSAWAEMAAVRGACNCSDFRRVTGECWCHHVRLGWESCRHVGDMSARQPKVGTFGRQAPDEPTQIRSRHIILCRGLPTFSKFSLSTRGTYGVIIVQTGMYKY